MRLRHASPPFRQGFEFSANIATRFTVPEGGMPRRNHPALGAMKYQLVRVRAPSPVHQNEAVPDMPDPILVAKLVALELFHGHPRLRGLVGASRERLLQVAVLAD
jgi:hypothetical protein